jgi:hypothetical protein
MAGVALEITVTELMDAMRRAEDRLEIDPMTIELFADGSGNVMAPCRDYSAGGERTDDRCMESVFAFDTIDGLRTWLESGEPEEDED